MNNALTCCNWLSPEGFQILHGVPGAVMAERKGHLSGVSAVEERGIGHSGEEEE